MVNGIERYSYIGCDLYDGCEVEDPAEEINPASEESEDTAIFGAWSKGSPMIDAAGRRNRGCELERTISACSDGNYDKPAHTRAHRIDHAA